MLRATQPRSDNPPGQSLTPWRRRVLRGAAQRGVTVGSGPAVGWHARHRRRAEGVRVPLGRRSGAMRLLRLQLLQAVLRDQRRRVGSRPRLARREAVGRLQAAQGARPARRRGSWIHWRRWGEARRPEAELPGAFACLTAGQLQVRACLWAPVGAAARQRTPLPRARRQSHATTVPACAGSWSAGKRSIDRGQWCDRLNGGGRAVVCVMRWGRADALVLREAELWPAVMAAGRTTARHTELRTVRAWLRQASAVVRRAAQVFQCRPALRGFAHRDPSQLPVPSAVCTPRYGCSAVACAVPSRPGISSRDQRRDWLESRPSAVRGVVTWRARRTMAHSTGRIACRRRRLAARLADARPRMRARRMRPSAAARARFRSWPTCAQHHRTAARRTELRPSITPSRSPADWRAAVPVLAAAPHPLAPRRSNVPVPLAPG